jgi:hypothetical protein
MSRNLSRLMRQQARQAADARWVIGVEGIVAENEDPENLHRIKVKIEILDEFKLLDKWVRQIGCYVGGPGYGSFFVPEKGSEVILFGRLGEKHNLYYMSVYNEDFPVSADFDSPAKAGIRAPGDLRFITDGDLQLRGGGMHIETTAALNITAPGGIFLNGEPVS